MIPACFETFAMNAELGSFVLSEQVQSNTFEEGEILGRMFLPFAIQVFAETDIQSPMQFVFDAPVLAYRSVQLDGIRRETGDVIAGLSFRDPGSFVIALSLNPYQPAQAGPFLRLFQQT